jgi:hypothetical protein
MYERQRNFAKPGDPVRHRTDHSLAGRGEFAHSAACPHADPLLARKRRSTFCEAGPEPLVADSEIHTRTREAAMGWDVVTSFQTDGRPHSNPRSFFHALSHLSGAAKHDE